MRRDVTAGSAPKGGGSRSQTGIDARILTAGARTHVNVVRHAGRASYGTLLEAGVRVFAWRPSTLHAKPFVVDGSWSTIGLMFDRADREFRDASAITSPVRWR